jgi:hypothetical protein
MSGITQTEQVKKPKERFLEILMTIFELIEETVPEGVYLQVAEQLKQANKELDKVVTPEPQVRIVTLVQEARQNFYYRNYVTRPKPLPPRLTEAMKAKDANYYLCRCGRFCHRKPEYIEEHLETQVHYQGIRNKKLSALKAKKVEGEELKKIDIEAEIRREVVVEGFALRHLQKQKEKMDEPEPEPEPVVEPVRRRLLIIEDDSDVEN